MVNQERREICGGSCSAIDGEWHSELPDGTEVLVQRHGAQWIVHCGTSHVIGGNLDVALAQAVRAETDVVGHAGYSAWIRRVADELARDE